MNFKIESPLTKFVLKAVAFFIAWYVVYELWLLPNGAMDEWIALNVTEIGKGILQWWEFDIFSYNRVIGIYGNAGVEIVDGCNGIAPMGLFLGFMIAYPGEKLKKISFVILGILAIYLSNIIRIVVLVITQDSYPELFGFFHDYTTTAIFYFIIFGLWMIWVNYSDAEFS